MINEKLAKMLSISTEDADLILADKLMPTKEQQKILATEMEVSEEYVASFCGGV